MKMFNELEILEQWYNNNIINLQEYLKIKSNIVDFYIPKNDKITKDEMPF